jgi:hypothetical protein
MTRMMKRCASDMACEAVHKNDDDVLSFLSEHGPLLVVVDDDVGCREKQMQIQGLPRSDCGCTSARQLVETCSGGHLSVLLQQLASLPLHEIQNGVVSQIVEGSKTAEHHLNETMVPRKKKTESVRDSWDNKLVWTMCLPRCNHGCPMSSSRHGSYALWYDSIYLLIPCFLLAFKLCLDGNNEPNPRVDLLRIKNKDNNSL